jgi:hypothetical protein
MPGTALVRELMTAFVELEALEETSPAEVVAVVWGSDLWHAATVVAPASANTPTSVLRRPRWSPLEVGMVSMQLLPDRV